MLFDLLNWFTEPFQFEFMRTALYVSVFVGIVSAILSCYMILMGWSLMGDALSHAVLPGVVIAYIVGLPFALGAFISGLLCASAIGWVKRHTRVKEDTTIGVLFTAFFAFGIILVSRTPSNVHLMHFIYGNVLGIERSDLLQTLISGAIVLIVIAVLRRDLLLFVFDPHHARAIGLRTSLLYYTLLALLALTVVATLQTVGVILAVAMLITPGAIGFLLTDRFDRMMLLAIGAAVSASIIGVYLSFYLDASTAGCIVVGQAMLFFAAVVFGPRRGMLVRTIQHRRARRTSTMTAPLANR